jgi:hypothetical protein
MHHKLRLVVTVAAAALAVALIGSARVDRGARVDIGTAMQSHDAGRTASRSAEQVRYDDIDLELLATYLVDDGLVSPTAVPLEHRQLWTEVVRVLPTSAVAEIRQVNVVTDGADGTLAMVHRSGIDTDHWILTIDVAEPVEVLRPTLVHEYAHMLTLRHDQLRTGREACEGVELAIGCATPDSPLAEWATAFWPQLQEPGTYDRTRFVSDYAATSVHEDFAETFLAYVTGSPELRGDTLEAKAEFFDARPELASAAAEMRARVNLT